MRLRRKRVEAAAARQGVDGAELDSPSADLRSRRSEGRVARMGDAFAKRIAALSPREQSLVAGGAVVLLLALLISVGVLPAWRSLQQGPARQQALNAQIARLAQLEVQAQALKARPVWSSEEAATKLQASSAGLAAPGVGAGGAVGQGATGVAGAAGGAPALPLQLNQTPQQTSATLRALPADTLTAWLTAAREQAHAVPSEAKLTRETGAEGADRWSGTLVMRLPP